MVCLKYVGITDSVRERLKMSMKTFASWSVDALSTCPGKKCLARGLVNVDLFNGLAHMGYRERYHTVVWNSWCSHAYFSVACLKASMKGIQLIWYAHVTGQLASGFPFVVRNSFQTLPHPTSVKAGVVGFNLNPVLTLCLFDGSSEGIAGFIISVRISLPLLESGSSSLQLDADVACNPWLLVGICILSLPILQVPLLSPSLPGVEVMQGSAFSSQAPCE